MRLFLMIKYLRIIIPILIFNCMCFSQDVEFVPLQHGEVANLDVYLTTKQKSGGKLLYSNAEKITSTDSLQLKIGLHFGVKYIIKSADKTGTTILKFRWRIIHLDNREEEIELYDLAETNNTKSGVSLLLEEEADLIPGLYILDITYAPNKTHTQKFYLYK